MAVSSLFNVPGNYKPQSEACSFYFPEPWALEINHYLQTLPTRAHVGYEPRSWQSGGKAAEARGQKEGALARSH